MCSLHPSWPVAQLDNFERNLAWFYLSACQWRAGQPTKERCRGKGKQVRAGSACTQTTPCSSPAPALKTQYFLAAAISMTTLWSRRCSWILQLTLSFQVWKVTKYCKRRYNNRMRKKNLVGKPSPLLSQLVSLAVSHLSRIYLRRLTIERFQDLRSQILSSQISRSQFVSLTVSHLSHIYLRRSTISR